MKSFLEATNSGGKPKSISRSLLGQIDKALWVSGSSGSLHESDPVETLLCSNMSVLP